VEIETDGEIQMKKKALVLLAENLINEVINLISILFIKFYFRSIIHVQWHFLIFFLLRLMLENLWTWLKVPMDFLNLDLKKAVSRKMIELVPWKIS
jgi:hypothetical protein